MADLSALFSTFGQDGVDPVPAQEAMGVVAASFPPVMGTMAIVLLSSLWHKVMTWLCSCTRAEAWDDEKPNTAIWAVARIAVLLLQAVVPLTDTLHLWYRILIAACLLCGRMVRCEGEKERKREREGEKE
jgi:hypothetical protein